jgi:hypothetical protein
MKKILSLSFVLMLSVLLIACEPPSIGDVAVVEPAISLSSATLNLNVGETKPLGVTVQGFSASELRYVSEDPSIASVNAAGNVTALKPGAVQVTASYQGLSQSVVVFVLPEVEVVQVEVVDVQLNTDNEIILIYSDGTVENTGVQGVVEAAEPVTITSTVVNAQGNLIITLSDGTTYNAGRVVGPAGPTGASGGGGSGSAGPAGPTGPQGPQGNPGDFDADDLIALINREFLLSQLGIDSATWEVISTITLNQWSGLRSLNISQEGFRTLLGITQDQLNALIGLDGLISYNRYLRLYPGYDQPEDVWFRELNDGTLRVTVEFDLTSTLGEIYYAAGTDNSGLNGIDYSFYAHTTSDSSASKAAGDAFNGLSDAQQDAYFTSGTMYIGTATLETMELDVIKYAGASPLTSGLLGQIPGAFLNRGSVTTLKGALINPSNLPGLQTGVSAIKSNLIFNHFHDIHQFKQWTVTSGTTGQSGLFVMSNASLKAQYEPKQNISITGGGSVSYLSASVVNSFASGLEELGITQSVSGSGLFVNGQLVDMNGFVVRTLDVNHNDYFNHYVPMYTAISPFFPGLSAISDPTRNDKIYNGQEFFWIADNSGKDNGNLSVTDYLGSILYVNNPNSQGISANIRGNTLRQWDMTFTAMDSGLAVTSFGIFASSGFQTNSGITNGSGFVQVTNPIQIAALINNSGFIDTNVTNPRQPQTEWTFMGVTYSGISGGGNFSGAGNPAVPIPGFNSNLSTNQTSIVSTGNAVTGDPTVSNEGDMLFVRQEVNFSDGTAHRARYMYVQDTVAPIIQPIALKSNNDNFPTVAKEGDVIRIMIRANEPVKYVYTACTNTTFFSSGISTDHNAVTALVSGLASICAAPNNQVSVGSRFSTYLLDEISPKIAANDKEGFFAFSGLRVEDRAGNHQTIASTMFDSTPIWIDPIAPLVTESGFTSTNYLYSGVEIVSGVHTTTTSGVGSELVYLVSGILDYEFLIKETFNEITSGFVFYEIWPQNASFPSGSGLVTGGTTGLGNNSSNPFRITGQYREFDSGFNVVTGVINTSQLENGLYSLNVKMTDYAGNIRTQIYYLYVVNPLQYVNVTVADYEEQVLAMNFSTDIFSSGTFATSDLTVSIFRTSGNSTVSTQNITIQNLSDINNPNTSTRTILVKIITSGPTDQFYFGSGDRISVRIEQSGIDKLFANLTKEAILVPTPSTRTLVSDWPTAPIISTLITGLLGYPDGLIHPVLGEYPYIQSDIRPELGFFESQLQGLGSGITVSGLTTVSGTGVTQDQVFDSGFFSYNVGNKIISMNRTVLPASLSGDYVIRVSFSDDSSILWTFKEYDSFNGQFYLE